MKYEPVKDPAERKRIFVLIEQCKKEQMMSDITTVPFDYIVKHTKTENIVSQDKHGDYVCDIETEYIPLVRCKECRKVREGGGHANCNGHLYCRKWKTLVDEDDYCSWGEREGE